MYNVYTVHQTVVCHITSVPSLSLPPCPFLWSRQVKSPTTKVTPEVLAQSTPQPIAEASSTASSTPGPTDICRVQIRLPNGQVIRQNFPPSACLNDVVIFVMEKEPPFSTVFLMQVHVTNTVHFLLSTFSLQLG